MLNITPSFKAWQDIKAQQTVYVPAVFVVL